eukprot:3432153-Rhodomonas_salina.2
MQATVATQEPDTMEQKREDRSRDDGPEETGHSPCEKACSDALNPPSLHVSARTKHDECMHGHRWRPGSRRFRRMCTARQTPACPSA